MRRRFPDFDIDYYAPSRRVEPLGSWLWKQLALARTLAPLPLLLWPEIALVVGMVFIVRGMRRGWR